MSHLESTDSCPTFDDILAAVQESKRGRWFLLEYESRIQKRETAGILQAIQRLERRMESLTTATSTPEDVQKVKTAIASARKDLAQLQTGATELSAEARMFADLADLARKSIPANDDSKDKIVRSLQLVDEIDRALENVTDTGTRYFAADAQLFERRQSTDTVEEKAITPPVKEDASRTGARLLVNHVEASATQEQEPTSPVSEPSPTVEPDQFKAHHPRIVIVRRNAEDMPEVEVNLPEPDVSAA